MCRLQRKVSEEEEQKLDNGKKELSDILSEKYRSDIYEYERSTAGNRNPADVAPYMVMTGAAFGMLAFFGLTLLSIGIIGIYLMNILNEAKKMPHYVIRQEETD